MGKLLPDTALAENIRSIGWLKLPYRNDDFSLNAISQCFIIKTESRIFVVDTCIGNDKRVPGVDAWDHMQTDFLETLADAQVDRHSVTDVICTHLHVDHVGWNTYLSNGRWLPTFPNANYHFSQVDYLEYHSAIDQGKADELLAAWIAESIQPVFEAGLVKLIEPDVDLGDGISVISTPVHTNGHIAIEFRTGQEHFIIAGDSFHHPCQIARPQWATVADFSQAQSIATRQRLLSHLAGTRTLIAGSHFCIPSFGRIIKAQENGYEFTTVNPTTDVQA
ncbi:Metallo-beta-lactamase superfamily protein [compost metagenome]|uniref:Metallo-beta-lactamase domain-containing protein n=1 Tax=Achromobacter agilis TaxID=1353888 RepID=A0A446CB07_9BURK|nr:MBL fold metallo-hydrolase [Achromobacter agilis]SSW64990.1 hypothetical protein AGI3411_01872 [Achromobacter agilis]